MLRAILKSLRTGVVTTRYPGVASAPPEGFRGAPELRSGARFADLPPSEVCPVGAISTAKSADGSRYLIDCGRCVFCGLCAMPRSDGAHGAVSSDGAHATVGALDTDSAIATGREFELATRRREDLVVEIQDDGEGRAIREREDRRSALPASDAAADAIRRTLGRSLHLRHLDAGSCNGCDWELTALLNPVYDVRRLGIDFVASPRHADGVIVTGAMTRNLELAARRTWEAVPSPRVVIAVGACAASGGICGRSYASLGGVAETLPVDVFIPGCPPRPEAIIFGILTAIGRRAERAT